MAFIQIKNLHAQYNTDEGEVYALNGFDLSMEKEETLGIVGETGAGKTTMALSILNLLPKHVGEVSQGEILYEGKDLLKASKREIQSICGRKISMIFQDPMTSLNPVITVGRQIREILELHYSDMTKKEMEDRVDEMMIQVGIPSTRKDEYPHQFSGGMKQRIVIAMALIAKPELLLADEPTTALDVTIQAQILNLITKLKEKMNTSIMLITHDLGVVAQVCNNVSIVYAGEVIEYGSVKDVYSRTRNHPYTEGLFASIPDLDLDEERLTSIPGFMADPTVRSPGCRFAPRCSKRMDICVKKSPPLYNTGTHKIKCYLFNKEDT